MPCPHSPGSKRHARRLSPAQTKRPQAQRLRPAYQRQELRRSRRQEEKSISIRSCKRTAAQPVMLSTGKSLDRLFAILQRGIDNKAAQSSGCLSARKAAARESGAMYRCHRIPPWPIRTCTSSSSGFYRSNEPAGPLTSAPSKTVAFEEKRTGNDAQIVH